MENKIMDIHSHFVPDVYAAALKKHNALLEDGFPTPCWDVESHLDFMDQAGIAWSLLSISSPQPYFGNASESRELCRAINEFGAKLKKDFPDRFGYAACLPLPDIQGAVLEARYALENLGANAIKLASNSRGLYLGEDAMEPLFQYLNDMSAVVIIHPHRPEPLKEGIFTAGPVPLFEFMCDTTRAVMNLIARGHLKKYNRIKFVVPHCGAFLPNIFQRFEGISQILAPKGLMEKVDVKEAFASLYFDTAGNPVPYLLDLLRHFVPDSHILYGSDHPYTPDGQKLELLQALKDQLKEAPTLSEDILYKNAQELFSSDLLHKIFDL